MKNLFDRLNEFWLPIPGFERYLISNLGRVFSKITNRVMKPSKDGGGYLQVKLWKNGGVYPKRVNRLVLEAFCPTADSTLQANHINGIKTDNRLENLAWVTASDNIRHSVYQLGNTHGRKPKTIGKFDKDGKLLAIYRSTYEASRETGVQQGNIWRCARNLPRYSHAGGYVWRYIDETNPSKAA